MAAISASTPLPAGGLIDPTKQAEYPVVLGERLAAKDSTTPNRLVNIQYNYKSKSATPQQRSTISRSSRSQDAYTLTITDKAPTTEQNTLTYTYEGSVDPEQPVSGSEEKNLVLVFDTSRKVFVLEPVATQLNFNIRSAPAKTAKQVLEQYDQLKTLLEDDQACGDDQLQGEGEGLADDSNPYDYRHFLPKDNAGDEKSTSDISTPEPSYSIAKITTPVVQPVTKPAAGGPLPRSKPPAKVQSSRQAKPARQNKNATSQSIRKTGLPTSKPDTRAGARGESESLSSDAVTGAPSHKSTPSPGSNIIIDGDLIIDMGSPPPSRPVFKVNPAHFSSSNTPSNLPDGDGNGEEVEDLCLPSPAGRPGAPALARNGEVMPSNEEEAEDDDALAAEMEAAFEESAREEEARSQQYQQQQSQYRIPSDDESEVSEEE